MVEADVLKPYSFQGAGFSVSGVIQNRVVRSSVDGTLDFYWRIIPDASSTGDITAFVLDGLDDDGFVRDGDFRLDDAGSVGPDIARLSDGVAFLFSDGVSAGESSFFFFLDTQATAFSNAGGFYDLVCDGDGISPFDCFSVFTTFGPALLPPPPQPPLPPPPQGCPPPSLGDTCIDFNTLLDGTPTSDPAFTGVAVDGLYSPLGVNFRSKDDAGPTFSDPLDPFSRQSIVITDSRSRVGGTFNIVAEFLTPTNFVSADVLSEAGRLVRMTAKDASGAILGSTTSPSETILAFPFKGNVALSGIGAISTVEFEAVPDPAFAGVAIDNLSFSVVFEAVPVSEAPSAPVPIPCQRKSCRVTILCISAEPCNNAITVSVRQPRRSSVSETSGEVSDGRRAKAPLMAPFASGAASNIPPRQVASVKLKITKKGRRIAQSGVKKLRGVMSISNVAGSATLRMPIRIKLK